MKAFMSLGLFFYLCGSAFAAPQMDTGVGTPGAFLATVVPDHQNAHLYYVFPQASQIASAQNGKKDFLYVEDRLYRRRSYRVQSARLSLTLAPSFEHEALSKKIEAIRKLDPAARFTPITAFQTEVVSLSNSNEFMSSNCGALAGPLEVPVQCELNIHPRYSAGFRKILKNAHIHVLAYVYHFYGAVDGQIKAFSYSVPLRVGSLNDGEYFFDQQGRELN